MNYIFIGFLLVSIIAIILSFRGLISVFNTSKTIQSSTQNISDITNQEKARVILNLVISGFFLRHTMENDYPERNDDEHISSYKNFINDEDLQNMIRQTSGVDIYDA